MSLKVGSHNTLDLGRNRRYADDNDDDDMKMNPIYSKPVVGLDKAEKCYTRNDLSIYQGEFVTHKHCE